LRLPTLLIRVLLTLFLLTPDSRLLTPDLNFYAFVSRYDNERVAGF
jgi:hypothetical protein